MSVAKLFPYRDASGRLMFRGKIGHDVGGGARVSKFFPTRVGDALVLRGMDTGGKILYGYPYRDTSGRLMARTVYPVTDCTLCDYDGAAWATINVTISGFTYTGSCPQPTAGSPARHVNAAHALARSGSGVSVQWSRLYVDPNVPFGSANRALVLLTFERTTCIWQLNIRAMQNNNSTCAEAVWQSTPTQCGHPNTLSWSQVTCSNWTCGSVVFP